ncbi:MAG: hypothetical protein OEW24_07775, partial [Chloroflexota bacterium]|nr:hypothetical protein [Chloroflexota bacterium]
SFGNAAYEQPRSVGSISLCLTEAGTATITSAAIHGAAGDIRVEAFAVRPNPFARGLDAVGAESRTLVEIDSGFDPGAVQQVSAVCPAEGQMDDESVTSLIPEFAVQVSWSSGDLAGGDGIDVNYEINGSQHTALVPFAIWVCRSECPRSLPNGGVGS